MIRVESARDQVNIAKVYEAGQEQIFEYWEELSTDQRRSLLEQVASIDFAEFTRLVHTELHEEDPKGSALTGLQPPQLIGLDTDPSERDAAKQVGLKALKNGEVAIFLVAGGQGTRLKFDGPKGMFPIGPISDRTLFQYQAEQLFTLQRQVKRSIPWIIMTSELNHDQTQDYFAAHSYFGLNASDLIFRKQAMLPIVDPRRGKILLAQKHQLALSPNGHGGSIQVMRGLSQELQRRGIQYLFYFQVDNPLTPIGDPEFIGHHILADSQFSSKSTPKRNAGEKVGVFCRVGAKLRVVEYSELPKAACEAVDSAGQLEYRAGNIAQHVLSTEFVIGGETEAFAMPYHIARKAISCVRDGEIVEAGDPNSARFESFIFDVLPYAKNPIVLEVDRNQEFGPVKNLVGEDSPESCRTLLANRWAAWLDEAGIQCSRESSGKLKQQIEISPLFANNSQELRSKLNGAELDLTKPILLE